MNETIKGFCRVCGYVIYRRSRWTLERTSLPAVLSIQEITEPIPLNYAQIQLYEYSALPDGKTITACPCCKTCIT